MNVTLFYVKVEVDSRGGQSRVIPSVACDFNAADKH